MLSDQIVRSRSRSSVAERARSNKVGLRLALAVIATVYIVGPTAAQWVALEETRSAVRSEFIIAESGGAGVASYEPSPAGVIGGPAEAPTRGPTAGGPDPIGNASDGAVVDLVSPAVPEGLRAYLPAAIDAISARTSAAETAAGGLLAAAARGVVVTLALAVSVVVGARLGKPYRPRHAQTSTAMRVFF